MKLLDSNLFFLAPKLPILSRKKKRVAPLSEFDRGQYGFVGVYGQRFDVSAARSAMGIDWMTRAELAQAIPPEYTKFLGWELLRILKQTDLFIKPSFALKKKEVTPWE